MNTILADIIKHMTPDRAFEDAYPQVSSSLANTPCSLETEVFVVLMAYALW